MGKHQAEETRLGDQIEEAGKRELRLQQKVWTCVRRRLQRRLVRSTDVSPGKHAPFDIPTTLSHGIDTPSLLSGQHRGRKTHAYEWKASINNGKSPTFSRRTSHTAVLERIALLVEYAYFSENIIVYLSLFPMFRY